ncbi:MAG TPA: DUF748 domain-containing protein [Cyclobacteriaceae bacterium]|nr:DUF748 domain-containing protein [Cyclobacteriaceae bacterium]
MRPIQRTLLKAALITIVSAAILLFTAGIILSAIVTGKVKAKLESANAQIGSLSINLFTRAVTIKNFEWSPAARPICQPDSSNSGPHSVIIHDIRASGIHLMSLFRDHQVSVRKIEIENGSVFINRSFKTCDTPGTDSIKFKGFDVDLLSIQNIAIRIAKDTVNQCTGKAGLILHYVALDSAASWRNLSAYTMKNIETTVRELKIENWDELYAFQMKEISFDKELMRLHIDSLELIPQVEKKDWGKKVKSQVTRTTMVVGNILAEGVNMAVHMQDTSIMVSAIDINGPAVHAYKDKRYPFTRKDKFPLPMEAFRAMHISIEVDSIRIHDGSITYEEFPVEGFRPAHISFEDLQATMSSVNNRDFKNMTGYSTLRASAHIMKTGEVNATFKLPLEKNKRYSAEGSVKNLPLKELNPLIKDIAFIEIASGQLNSLDFAFTYDDIGSQGQLRLDYENLRILSLKKEKEGDVAAFKTLLVNTAMKNAETLTGEISVQRNQRKAVFNLWTISIVDGMRSALLPRRKDKGTKAK